MELVAFNSRRTLMELVAYLARDRAIQMAQEDWRAGRIGEADVINKARQYEADLLGKEMPQRGWWSAARNERDWPAPGDAT